MSWKTPLDFARANVDTIRARSHHSRHGNYPSETCGGVRVSIPEGRCAFCSTAPEPCRWCQHNAQRCTGCGLLQCNGANVQCGRGP
jgi:hypothetical protein